jgi:hypothetical protein
LIPTDVATIPLTSAKLEFEHPPSLARRGPAWVEVRDSYGAPVPLGPSGFQLTANRVYQIAIFLQIPDPLGQVTKVDVRGGEQLRELVATEPVPCGESRIFSAKFRPTRSRRPFPTMTEWTINLYHDRFGTLSLHIPVVIWSSFGAVLLLGLTIMTTVANSFASGILDTLRNSPNEVLTQLADGWVSWVLILSITPIAFVIIWLFGRSRVWFSRYSSLDGNPPISHTLVRRDPVQF